MVLEIVLILNVHSTCWRTPPIEHSSWSTALCLFAGAVIGDSMAQWFTGGPYDVLRNLRMSVYGLMVGGPSGHYWHQVGCICIAIFSCVMI